MKSNIAVIRIKEYFRKLTTKNIIIVASIVLLVILAVIWKIYQGNQADLKTKQEMMYHVTTGDIQVQVKVNAKASLLDEQKLSFGQEGKIVSVKVDVGDEVKAGDILAELDLKEYYNSVQAAELELKNAQIGLNKLLTNDTSLAQSKVRSQIQEAQLSLNVESEQYAILKKQLATTLQEKKDQLTQLQREYALAKKELDITGTGSTGHASPDSQESQYRQQKISSIKGDLSSMLGDAETIIKSVDKIFGVSESLTTESETYYIGLSLKSPDLRNKTETYVQKGYSFINSYDSQINAISYISTDNQIYSLIQDIYNGSSILVSLCDTALDALDMSVETADISQASLDSFSTIVSASRTTAVSIRSELKSLLDSVNSILSTYETKQVSLETQSDDINILKNGISTIATDNSNQLSRKQAQIDTIKSQINVLNQELQDIRKGVDADDIAQQKNLISQAELNLTRTKDQKDEYQIISDFDGRVRSVDIAEGEQYKIDDKNYIVVENPNLIELKLQVSQIDIVKIREGQHVLVTFDAYPYTPIQTTITSRNVNPELNQKGGVYYTAKILLEKQDLEILAGMSALVTIQTAEAKNAVIVPTLSLIHKGDTSYVYLREGDKYALHEVEIGISNNFQAQIRSGLQAGDIILGSVLDEKTLEEMGITDGGLSISLF